LIQATHTAGAAPGHGILQDLEAETRYRLCEAEETPSTPLLSRHRVGIIKEFIAI